jgi:ribulose-5-phosphate 4-epimerase/fuculose-1-phosphate aldolase
MDKPLATALLDARRRVLAKGLFAGPDASVSLRLPAGGALLIAEGTQAVRRCDWNDGVHAIRRDDAAALHAMVYRLRPDVGAVLVGGGRYARLLAESGEAMPVLFDEQARHLGRMGPAAAAISEAALAEALRDGGNALLAAGGPMTLGTTGQRMVFNAELFEKCATAWLLASSTGEAVAALPWWVGHIANGRLMKDERRATQRFARGQLPEDVRGY